MGIWAKAKGADSAYSVASWGPAIFQYAFPSAWVILVGTAAAYRDWIWNDYGMLGVLVIGLCAGLIASIAFAIVGLGLRAWRAAPPKPGKVDAPAPLTLAQPSARMVLAAPPTSTLISPDRFYSRAEKERIVDTMNFIQQRFTNGREMMFEAEKVASNPGHNAELDNSIAKIQTVHTEAEQLNIDLDKIRNESDSYPVSFAVLLAAKPVYSDEFQRAVYDYSNALYVYRHLLPEGEHRGAVAKVLDSEKRHLSRAKHFFGKWMDECDEQMRAARRSLDK